MPFRHACLSLLLLWAAAAQAIPATYVVDNNGDPATGTASNCSSFPSGTCTLRDAIAAASNGGTITFSLPPVVITLTNGPIAIANSGGTVTINGTNQQGFPVIIDGDKAAAPAGGTGVFVVMPVASAVIQNLTIQNGLASPGAGIANYGTLTLSNDTFSGNVNDGLGGGGGAIFNQGTLTITGSTLTGNTAGNATTGQGGGIYNAGTLTMSNSTLAGNSAQISGGGFYETSVANATLTNVTFFGNSAPSGPGIADTFGMSKLANTLVADGCSNSISDQGGNLDSGVSCGFGVSSKSGATLNLDPLLRDNGGATKTLLPGPGSDAIDYFHCANAPAVDQRGVTRPQGGFCDSGSVEVRQYSLTMGASGSGTVSSATPALPPIPITYGIDTCGAGPTGTCSGKYGEAWTVTLVATPANGWHTASWGDACIVTPGNANQASVFMHTDELCSVTFAVNAPQLGLQLGGSGGYARYGQTLAYTATLSNTGTGAASNVGVDFALSAGLDAANATWDCQAAGGAACPASSGASMLIASLPAGGSLTWTLHVAVLANTPETAVSVQGSLNSVVQATDTATVVIFRGTFD